MLAFARSEKASLHMADLPAKSADDEGHLDGQKTALNAESALSGEFLGRRFLGGFDWRRPIITYLQDPSRKTDKAVRRLALKFTLIDDDLYR